MSRIITLTLEPEDFELSATLLRQLDSMGGYIGWMSCVPIALALRKLARLPAYSSIYSTTLYPHRDTWDNEIRINHVYDAANIAAIWDRFPIPEGPFQERVIELEYNGLEDRLPIGLRQ